MSDRELLENAAKAAWYAVRWHEVWECFVHVGPHNITSPPSMAGQRDVWVPLEDDGDALRLAVALQMDVFVRAEWVEVVAPMGAPQKVHYEHGGREEATRLAIVRAAAAVWEKP